LLTQAKKAGKIESSYEIPEAHRRNLPETLSQALSAMRRNGFFSTFPFGCDYTAEELVLQKALPRVAAASAAMTSTIANLLPNRISPDDERIRPYLERLSFEPPKDRQEKLLHQAVARAVAEVLGLE
jgi:hypothetical protein